MVSHLFIGRDGWPLSWLKDEDQLDSSDTFAFGGLGNFVPHDPHCGERVSASLGGAFTLRPGRGSVVGSPEDWRSSAAAAPPVSLAGNRRPVQ